MLPSILFVFLALASLPAWADTITVSPANPDASTPTTLQIAGISPGSAPIYLHAVSVVGHTVHVEGCIPPGFSTPSQFQFSANVGVLNPGSYTIEFFELFCGPVQQPGNPTGPLFLRGTFTFSVPGDGTATAVPPTAQGGNWWNPAEPGTGYALDTRHGVLVMTVYSYNADGIPTWYLASGPIINNVATLGLDKYRGGQCISCDYSGGPTFIGTEGTVTITFTSPTTATMQLPGGRSFNIVPFDF